MITRITFGTSPDEVISIAFNMITLLYISINGGIENDLNKIFDF